MDSSSPGAPAPVGEAGDAGPDVEVVLRGEQLRVGTERVPVERVRFSKRVVTTTRTVEVPVRVEQLVVTHEPVTDGDAGTLAEPGGARGEEELVIVLHEEVPRVSLDVVPVEEVRVRVRTVAGEQVVTADLRRETVGLDVDGDVTVVAGTD
ncbi:DUF2382 domain-containing protein [Kineococcus sp. SYSU DK002]|uniref:DUF2382 domain-containing protein n=1 Tax=Kineococcus sp. SYSU DK002 TaxID=3383123 RepID=UPI003D7D8FE3